MMDDQAEWVAALIGGEMALPSPSEMAQAVLAQRQLVTRLYPDSPRYALELDPRMYREALGREMKMARRRSTSKKSPAP